MVHNHHVSVKWDANNKIVEIVDSIIDNIHVNFNSDFISLGKPYNLIVKIILVKSVPIVATIVGIIINKLKIDSGKPNKIIA